MRTEDLKDTLITELRYRVWGLYREYPDVDSIPELDAYSMWQIIGKPRNIQLLGAGYYIVEEQDKGLELRVWDEGNTEEQQSFLRGAYRLVGESGKESA